MAHDLLDPPVSATKPASVRAGFWDRLGAAILDGVVLFAASVAGSVLLGISAFEPTARGTFLDLALGVTYFAVLEGTSSQTLGKRMMSIRVVDERSGAPIGVSRAIWRWFGRIPSGLVVCLGYLWMLWDPNKQTWHDKLALSVVVRV